MASSPSASPSESASASPSESPSASESPSPSASASSSPSVSPSASESASASASPSTSASASPSASPSSSPSPSPAYYAETSAVGGNRVARTGTGLICVVGSIDIDEVVNTDDIFHMVQIPAGATLLDCILAVPALDSGTDLTLSVGYTGALEAFISQSTVGQAGGIARLSVAGGANTLFAAEDTIQVSATLGGAGVTEGTIWLAVFYTMDP